jgi:hypothetical protein
MSLKTIQMDPTHLKITKTKRTKKVIVPPSVMVNQPNLRQILLDKLMKHRKTQKRSDPMILNNNFDDQCVSKDPPVEPVIREDLYQTPSIMQDKPYGILKNGIKPTFKTWNKTQKNVYTNIDTDTVMNVPSAYVAPVENCLPEPIVIETPQQINTVIPVTIEPPSTADPVLEESSIVEKKVPIKVGKSKKNKTVHILIACNKTRKMKIDAHDAIRKTNLSTVKNYLKSRKLIKVGSTAPTNLIRQIYENAKSYGDVVNENKQNLLYNFEKDSES